MKKIKEVYEIIKGFFYFIDWKWFAIFMLIFTVVGLLDTDTTINWFIGLYVGSFVLVILAYTRHIVHTKYSKQNKK